MKKYLRSIQCVVLIIALMLSGFGGITASEVSAETTEGMTADGLGYKLAFGGIEITCYTGTKSELVIPSTIAGEKVTRIGAEAFINCSLTSVEIPEDVTVIGPGAFRKCKNLTSINIPEGLTTIGASAFLGCSSLTNINIPKGVITISANAFFDCSGLTNITIADGVKCIDDSAFYRCSGLTSIVIPGSVTSIHNSAFLGCNGLTNVEISEGLSFIGDSVFEGCSALTSIKIPSSVELIGNGVFKGCNSLTSVENYACGTQIFEEVFYGCSSLTNFEIPSSVMYIGDRAFYGCSSLTNIEIPEAVISIGNSAFKGCTNLISIEIPEKVTSIGDSAFEGCSGLASIKVAIDNSVYNSNDNCNAIIVTKEYSLIVGCRNTQIPSGVTHLEHFAFKGCSNLTSIDIPSSVTNVGSGVFSGCSGLTSVEIPNSVTSMGAGVFEGCSGLTSIEMSSGVTSIEHDTFKGCSSLTSIEIPNSVTSIDYGVFSGCSSLKSIEIPSNVVCLDANLFVDCPKDIIFYAVPGSTAETYAKVRGFTVKPIEVKDLETALGTIMPQYTYDGAAKTPAGKDISIQWQNNELTEGVDYQIVSYANNTLAGTASVTIEGIGKYTGQLVLVFEITKADKPTIVPIEIISVPYSNQTIGTCNLPDGWKWSETDISKALTVGVPVQATACYIATDKDCYKQTSVVVTVTRSKCEHKGEVILKNNVEATCKNAGYTGDTYCLICNALISSGTTIAQKEHNWDDGVISKPATTQSTGEMVYTCQVCHETRTEAIEKLPIPVKGEQRQDKDGKANYVVTKSSASKVEVAFAGVVKNTKTVTIPSEVILSDGTKAKVTSIAKNALKNNKKATKVQIGNNVKTIGNDAFSGCTKLKTVVMGKNVTTIGARAFKNCKAMASVTLGTKVTTIDKEAFRGCSKLKTITIKSKKLKKVGKNVFKGIKSNAKIKVPASKLKSYKQLLKGKGQGKKVKITK